jgi:GT2 family glycosyltransferase
MESRAPSVVALVATSQPDGRLAETLASLADQDYGALRVLVAAAPSAQEALGALLGGRTDVEVVALEEDRGFGAAMNQAAAQAGEAAFLLLCHDDVVLAPDAVHLMVEEGFRSNAGVVTPKVVSTQDPSLLLHVGQSVDRHGTIVERVLLGEIDQGQHDAVRDVFVAPGGVTLVRADLFGTLGGFDPRYVAQGDDLELCWRARLAGARLVCAPQAVVAHDERLAAGSRGLAPSASGGASLSRLKRRNDLRTLLVCLDPIRRAMTLSFLALLNLAEIIVAGVGGDHERAVDVRESWRSAWRERRENRRARRAVARYRTVSDRTVRSFQTPGVQRLRTFATTFLHHGFDAARGVIPPGEDGEYPEDASIPDTVGFGGAFSDDEGFDELDDLGHRGRRRRGARLSSARSLFFVCLVGFLAFVAGSRDLIGAHLPLIGQLVPLGSFTSLWHRVVASWQPAGVGAGAPAHPASMVLGLLGVVTLGQMGVLVRLVLLGAVPLGAVGLARLLAPVASARARVLGAFAYAGVALGINAIAVGSLSGLVAVALMPFLVRRVLRLLRVPPFDDPFPESVRFATRGWRRSSSGQTCVLGLLLALGGALAPALFLDVLLVSACAGIAGVLRPGGRALARQGRVLKALALGAALLAPLVVEAALGGRSGLGVFGTSLGPWSSPGLGGLLRFAVGPSGVSPLAWLLPIAALVPLLVARAERLVLATQLALIGVASLALALLSSRGGLGAFAPDLLVVLAPAAVAVAALVAVSQASLETDLAQVAFGWRQILAGLGLVLALLGLLPTLASVSNGRWKLPSEGYGEALSFLNVPAQRSYRVLWLGDPRSIPGASWQLGKGLAWATSSNGLPDAATLFVPPTPTAAASITAAVELALTGRTVRLGQLLAPAGIDAVVVTSSVSPSLPGIQSGLPTPPPAGLLPALSQQVDLRAVPQGTGVAVFESTRALARVSTRSIAYPPGPSASDPAAVAGWVPLAGGATPLQGRAQPGTRSAVASLAPASAFRFEPPGTTTSAFGFGVASSARPGRLEVVLSAPPLDAVINLAVLVAWLVVGLALLGRHRWLDWWWPAARRARRAAEPSLEEAQASAEVAS